MTANGTTEEATENACDLGMFVQVQLLKESRSVSFGKLCEANGSTYEWHPGQPSYLIKNGRTSSVTPTTTSLLVVFGVSAAGHHTRAVGDRKQARAVGEHEL